MSKDFTKDELRLIAKWAARQYVQRTDKVVRLTASILAKIAARVPAAALPSEDPHA